MQYFVYYTIPGESPLFPLFEEIDADTPKTALASFAKTYPDYVVDSVTIADYDNGHLIRVLPNSKN